MKATAFSYPGAWGTWYPRWMRAAQGEPVGSFSIYQLKGGSETLDYRFEPLDSIHRNDLSVKPKNYELVYEAPLTAKDDLESIYTRFNVDRPADFTGHSLSVSDIVVLHQGGKDTAHYCDRAGFSEVPSFCGNGRRSLPRTIWKPVSASGRPGAASM